MILTALFMEYILLIAIPFETQLITEHEDKVFTEKLPAVHPHSIWAFEAFCILFKMLK